MEWSIELISSPLGALACVVREGALVALEFEENGERLRRYLARRAGAEPIFVERAASEASRRIEAYFRNDLRALDDVAVDIAGTPFERCVYAELRKIPLGQVISYSELARRTGRPEAVRAVGAANAKNPISIVVPCHRVIGADGSLTGYAGGLDRKRWLLAHEGAEIAASRAQRGAARQSVSAIVSVSASGEGSRRGRSPRGAAASAPSGEEPCCSA